MAEFQPPTFQPHRIVRGGHLQTIVSIRASLVTDLAPTQHVVPVSDGDAVVLHEDQPLGQETGSMLLIHGLSGCHGAPYMIRLAQKFVRKGIRVFRMDMRGCGAGAELARHLTHAGRSDDVVAALGRIAELTESGPMMAIGVSLGANQLLRALGRIGAGMDAVPGWFDRLERTAAVAPPLDLQRCSDNMERWLLRPYNYYFIRALLQRAPPRVQQREEFQTQLRGRRPRTLRELDDRFTAPLSGFSGAAEYYAKSSSKTVIGSNPVPSLVLASEDDPLVPIACFVDEKHRWPQSSELLVTRTGGHVGFIDRSRNSWMDEVLAAWFEVAAR